MPDKKEKGEIIRFASWMSMFNFDSSSIRLHEISWIEADQQFKFSPKKIKRLLFLYTTGGRGLLFYKGKEYKLKYGDSFIIDMNEGFEIICPEKEWSFLWLQMSSKLSYKLLKHVESNRGNVVEVNTDIPTICDKIYNIASAGWSMKSDIEISSLLYYLIGLILIADAQGRRLENTLVYIQEHYSEKLRLEELAKISCMSLYHFIRSFQNEVGVTPHDYINEFRMKKAKELLIRTDMPISIVASEVGFEDASYFSELYKKTTGSLPREHRKLYHKDNPQK